ncbi:unnamed protein product, partial [Ascophyllum nodosum]
LVGKYWRRIRTSGAGRFQAKWKAEKGRGGGSQPLCHVDVDVMTQTLPKTAKKAKTVKPRAVVLTASKTNRPKVVGTRQGRTRRSNLKKGSLARDAIKGSPSHQVDG